MGNHVAWSNLRAQSVDAVIAFIGAYIRRSAVIQLLDADGFHFAIIVLQDQWFIHDLGSGITWLWKGFLNT
jgi:hypothetical protein